MWAISVVSGWDEPLWLTGPWDKAGLQVGSRMLWWDLPELLAILSVHIQVSPPRVFHPQKYPPRKDLVRAVSIQTGYLIQSTGPKSCVITYLAQVDPKGEAWPCSIVMLLPCTGSELDLPGRPSEHHLLGVL